MTEQGAFALRLARKIAADARQSTQTIQLSKGSRKKKFLREEEILAFKAQRNIYVALRKMRKVSTRQGL